MLFFKLPLSNFLKTLCLLHLSVLEVKLLYLDCFLFCSIPVLLNYLSIIHIYVANCFSQQTLFKKRNVTSLYGFFSCWNCLNCSNIQKNWDKTVKFTISLFLSKLRCIKVFKRYFYSKYLCLVIWKASRKEKLVRYFEIVVCINHFVETLKGNNSALVLANVMLKVRTYF